MSHCSLVSPESTPPAPGRVRVALVQMRVDGGRVEENLQRAVAGVEAAAAAGAHFVVLPETCDVGWTHPSARALASEVPEGSFCRELSQAARRSRVCVCSGLTERAGGRVFNAAVLFNPGGELVLHHRKLNELEIGHDCYDQGDRLGVAATPLGTVGVMICADAFARGQVVSRTLGLMGAQLILSPSAWAVPAEHDNSREPYGQLWIDNYGPVARDFRLWIAGVSNVGLLEAGPWAGRRCIGCSMVVGPDGTAIVHGPYGERAEALLMADLPLEAPLARGDGWERFWAAGGAAYGLR